MKTAIIYRSFFGATRKYAEQLHKEIEADIYKHNKIDELLLLKYDLFILCAGTYAGWISLSGYLKNHWKVLQKGRVILIVIGSAPVDAPWSVRSYEKIPEEIRRDIKYFKLPTTTGSREADKVRKENLAQVTEYINSI